VPSESLKLRVRAVAIECDRVPSSRCERKAVAAIVPLRPATRGTHAVLWPTWVRLRYSPPDAIARCADSPCSLSALCTSTTVDKRPTAHHARRTRRRQAGAGLRTCGAYRWRRVQLACTAGPASASVMRCCTLVAFCSLNAQTRLRPYRSFGCATEDTMRHATYSIRHATYNVQHAASSIRHAVCNTQQGCGRADRLGAALTPQGKRCRRQPLVQR
jgi:hypothetical protein